jgi:hypothetical protein
MSLILPTPAQILAKQVAHNESVTIPQIGKMWGLFTQWVNQSSPTGAKLHNLFGLTPLEYLRALENNYILFDISQFDNTSVELFIEEVNEIKCYVNFEEEYYQTQWTAQKTSMNRGAPEYETIPFIAITHNKNPPVPSFYMNAKHVALQDMKSAIAVWRSNYSLLIQNQVDELLVQLRDKMAKICPVSKHPEIIKYTIATHYYHNPAIVAFVNNVNNFKDSVGNQVWLATYTESPRSIVTVVPYESLDLSIGDDQ